MLSNTNVQTCTYFQNYDYQLTTNHLLTVRKQHLYGQSIYCHTNSHGILCELKINQMQYLNYEYIFFSLCKNVEYFTNHEEKTVTFDKNIWRNLLFTYWNPCIQSNLNHNIKYKAVTSSSISLKPHDTITCTWIR